MGARGPSPTPTETLKARGSRLAAAREKDGEPRLPPKAPPCPSWLSREAKAEWRRQVKQLLAMRVLTEADRALLAAYCEAWGEFVETAKAIDAAVKAAPKTGYAAAIAAGLVNAKNKAADRLNKLAQQFGLSPASRTRVRAETPAGEQAADGKGRFFKTVG